VRERERGVRERGVSERWWGERGVEREMWLRERGG
jgi:hypothetical protein